MLHQQNVLGWLDSPVSVTDHFFSLDFPDQSSGGEARAVTIGRVSPQDQPLGA
jgi:hypothetical protein